VIIQGEQSLQGRLADRKSAVSPDGKENTLRVFQLHSSTLINLNGQPQI